MYGERRNPHSRKLVTSRLYISSLNFYLHTLQTHKNYNIISISLLKNSNNPQFVLSSRPLLTITSFHSLIHRPFTSSYLIYQVQTSSFFFPSSPPPFSPPPKRRAPSRPILPITQFSPTTSSSP